MSRGLARLAAWACLLAAGCAGAPPLPGGARLVKVEAEGWAPMEGENLLSAKHRALADAQKKAVEKAVGVTVHAMTKVEDALNIRQSIEANLGGTIRRYEVVSERQEGGFYKTVIKADVIYRPPVVERALRGTRFAVRLPQEKVAGALRTELAANDFLLSDTESSADVLVTGVVETFGRADMRLGGFYTARAKVTLSVVDVRRGIEQERTFESTAIDTEEAAANEQALEQVGKLTGATLAREFDTEHAAKAD